MVLLRYIDNLLIIEHRIVSSIESKKNQERIILKAREISHERGKQRSSIFKVFKDHFSIRN
jgi:hypothetical protein